MDSQFTDLVSVSLEVWLIGFPFGFAVALFASFVPAVISAVLNLLNMVDK